MNSLVKSIIQPILEQDQSGIALIPGGFKPPTIGHFSLVDEVANHPEVNKVIVLIGHKTRDGVTKEESLDIWNIYKNHLPPNVEIQISDNSSPIADVNSLIKNNPDTMFYPVVGMRGEMDLGDLKRFNSMEGKYENFKPLIIKSEESENRISGTNTRAALIGGDKEIFQKYLPTELSNEEKEKVWSILTKTPIQEFVTQSELDDVERIADEWFEDYGIDVQFTRHFIERVNDERNGKPISAEELEDLFTQTAEKYGEQLANLPDDYQAVLFKLRNDINLPFALNYDDKNDEMDLVAKTVMRKKNFQTSNPKLALQEIYAEPSKFSYPTMLSSLIQYMLSKDMNIRPLPKVKFVDNDVENAKNFFGKTAYYDPNQRVVVLYTMDRHPKDVMRSFAHEMIHHEQNCNGKLKNITTQNTNEGGDLPEIEREAYEKGNMTFRNWTDTLTEGILGEGRYDKISNTISSDVFKSWKSAFDSKKTNSIKKFYYQSNDFELEVTAKILFVPGNSPLFVDGSMDDTGEHLELDFRIGTNKLPEFWEEISMNLKDVVRHEIEHSTQTDHDINQKPGKYMEDDSLIRKLIRAKLLPKSQYFKLEKEVDANLQGMYFRAKKEKRPFKNVINDYLNAQDITHEQKEEILNLWRSRLSSLNLPKF
jgi:phosphopantetheine adenylyltransferase